MQATPHPNVQVETYIIGDRKISLRTSVLEEKATACSMICCYADELKEGFYPYCEQVGGGDVHAQRVQHAEQAACGECGACVPRLQGGRVGVLLC